MKLLKENLRDSLGSAASPTKPACIKPKAIDSGSFRPTDQDGIRVAGKAEALPERERLVAGYDPTAFETEHAALEAFHSLEESGREDDAKALMRAYVAHLQRDSGVGAKFKELDRREAERRSEIAEAGAAANERLDKVHEYLTRKLQKNVPVRDVRAIVAVVGIASAEALIGTWEWKTRPGKTYGYPWYLMVAKEHHGTR